MALSATRRHVNDCWLKVPPSQMSQKPGVLQDQQAVWNKRITKQGIIFLVALWGLLAVLFGYVNALMKTTRFDCSLGCNTLFGVIMPVLVWGWYVPALRAAKALGILDHVCEREISVLLRNKMGWLRPVDCWYFINIAIFLKERMKAPTRPLKLSAARGRLGLMADVQQQHRPRKWYE